MSQIATLWRGLDARRRVILVLAALATAAAVLAIGRIAATPAMGLLYTNLDPIAAGEVVAALEQNGTRYEVRGSAIYVPAPDRDRLRMAMAAQNLPANGPAGYELLDSLSGFGTTSEMFDATYWRAKEGELARTILAAPNVRTARVHIANPSRRPFEQRTEPSASVIVTMASGTLGVDQARAVRFLVASAVAGLAPARVAVIDAAGGIVLEGGDAEGAMQGGGPAGERLSEALRTKLERLLGARVGQGRAIVEVTVETETESETITERVIDPESRVAIAADTEEVTESEAGSDSGAVTVASNLPDGEGAGGGASQRSRAETRSRTNFEVSEVLRERVRVPGEIRRISAAILVDGVRTLDEDGIESWAPRSEEELAALGELVRSAIGFDEARGDVVTIESLEFAPGALPGTEAGLAAGASFLERHAMTLAQVGILALVALGLAAFVLRPLLAARPEVPALEQEILGEAPALSGPELDFDEGFNFAANIVTPEDAEPGRLDMLREMIAERSEDSATLLRSWLDTSEYSEEPT
ncbi:MAG: flagellar basal-body MS-ring/collar protein FliF [Pseudomonadota bacterium]